MTYDTIQFEPGAIARITLNRPDRLNSFTAQMHEELRDALASLGDARVVVLTGAGRGFCAGQDLNDRAVAPGEAVDLGETVEKYWNPLIRTLTSVPQPVIARVNGVAAGAGAGKTQGHRMDPAELQRRMGQRSRGGVRAPAGLLLHRGQAKSHFGLRLP